MFSSVEKQELRVPAHIDYLGDLRDFVTELGRKHRFSDKVVNAFKLSVDEAATNIIRHAYRDAEGSITIRAIVKRNSLTLSIIDQGMYFDPKRVKDPDLNRYIDIGKKGGLGIFIMRKLMDEIDYRKTEEGNELRITKYRDKPVKAGLFKSVGTIPFSIKAKYFFRAIGIVTLLIALGYFYFFLKTDDELISNFISVSQATSRTIVHRIGLAQAEEFAFVEDIVFPIEEEYKEQIARISVEDSLGVIVYSSNVSEILSEFTRPENAEKTSQGIYKYSLAVGGEIFYEIEIPVIIKQLGVVYGKAHIYFSDNKVASEIYSIRFDSLQLALFILGMSYVGVALLIYLVMNPFRKLSEWVKNIGHDEVEDEMDIDASTEIGEIARAFSDIQSKFRDSQKNLVDQERLQREMQVAQEIQQTLLPMEFPELEGYQIAAFYEAAKEVGGDYYDFVEVDKDTLGIVVADVSGKGVPGSLVMTMIRTALRTEARGVHDAAEVLARVNAFVSNDIKKGMFVTVFYLIIDSKRRRVNYASAGHNPMILYRGGKKSTYYLNPKGFPVGVQLPDRDYFRNSIESDTIQLAKDDILLLYTDGITEAMNSSRQLYGEERLQKTLSDYGDLPADQFVERLKDSIYSFTEGSPQYDDITLVTIKEESTKEEDELRRAKEVHEHIGDGMSIKDACREANLTTYAYYNKYKKVFDEKGIDAFEVDDSIAVEAKHISIEEKSKIFDIIGNHPEYGAARIREELNTEKYSFAEISENRIYDELVRSRLNTKALREAYISKAKRSNRRIKAPGTPFMTLDGKVMVQEKVQTDYGLGTAQDVPPLPRAEDEVPVKPQKQEEPLKDEVVSDFQTEAFIDVPIEDLLADTGELSKSESDLPEQEDVHFDDKPDKAPDSEPNFFAVSADELMTAPDDTGLAEFAQAGEETSLLDDFSFEELFVDSGEINADESDDFDFDSATAEQAADTPVEPEMQGIADDLQDVLPANSENIAEQDAHEEDVAPVANIDFGDSESSLTASSIDELLGETEFAGTDSGDDFGAGTESDSVDSPPTFMDEDEDTVSFSDLIQAIDEEIVYVTEPSQQANNSIDIDHDVVESSQGEKPHDQTADSIPTNAAAESDTTKAQQAGGNGKSAHQAVQDRETILIDGIKHYKENDYNMAIEEFKRVINTYPDYKEAHSILGNAYFRNKMYNEAAIEYQKVKEIDPADITAYENMGVIYANRGEYRQAVGEWKKVIELSPDRADIEDKIRKAVRLI